MTLKNRASSAEEIKARLGASITAKDILISVLPKEKRQEFDVVAGCIDPRGLTIGTGVRSQGVVDRWISKVVSHELGVATQVVKTAEGSNFRFWKLKIFGDSTSQPIQNLEKKREKINFNLSRAFSQGDIRISLEGNDSGFANWNDDDGLTVVNSKSEQMIVRGWFSTFVGQTIGFPIVCTKWSYNASGDHTTTLWFRRI